MPEPSLAHLVTAVSEAITGEAGYSSCGRQTRPPLLLAKRTQSGLDVRTTPGPVGLHPVTRLAQLGPPQGRPTCVAQDDQPRLIWRGAPA